MRLQLTPVRLSPHLLRTAPAVVAFATIALATVDARFGSPVLGVGAIAVAIGLAFGRGFARPLGFGLVLLPLCDVASRVGYASELPSLFSTAVGVAALALLAAVTLAVAAPSGRSARAALAWVAVGAIVWRMSHGEIASTVRRELVLLALLAAAAVATRWRPRLAASLTIALGVVAAMSARLELDEWRWIPSVAGAWWIAEHGLRAWETRTTSAADAGPRWTRWAAAASLPAMPATYVVDVATSPYPVWGFTYTFVASCVGFAAVCAYGLVRRRAWAIPVTVGFSSGALLYWSWLLGSDPLVWSLVLPGVLVAPRLRHLDGRRALALVGLGAAIFGGAHYAFFTNAYGDPGDALLAIAGLGAVALASVGLARSRTWGLFAALAGLALLVVSTQAVSGPSAFDRIGGCMVHTPYPFAITMAGLALTLGLYAAPLARALRRAARPARARAADGR